MRTAKLTLFFCMILLVIPMIYAQGNPFETQVAGGAQVLDIRVPFIDAIKQGIEDVTLHTHVFNRTTGEPVTPDKSDVSCYLHLYNITGQHILQEEMTPDSNTLEWKLDIGAGNFSVLGQHSILLYCNNSDIGGFVSEEFEITQSGLRITDTDTLPAILAVLFVIILYMFLIRFFTLDVFQEHGAIKILLLLMSIWFMLIPVAIVTEVNVVMGGFTGVTELLDTLYMLLMWINIFITFYFIVWFLVQMLKKIGKTKDKIKLSTER